MKKLLARIRNRFRKKAFIELQPYAVEAVLMIGENTVLDRFACVIHAESKKHAKQRIKEEVYVKVGAVANKKQVETFKKK